MKTKVIVITIATILSSCQNFKISRVTSANVGTQNGIYYALPMTVLTFEIPVTKITLKPGMCFCKDESLMRSKGSLINELIKLNPRTPELTNKCEELKFDTTSYTYYKLGDPVINSYPVPDSSKIFFVSTKKNPLKKNNLTFILNELSVLNSAEIKTEDRTLDVVTQISSSIAQVVGKLLKSSEKDTKTPCEKLKEEMEGIVAAKRKLIANQNAQVSAETLNRQLDELRKIEESIIAQFTYTEDKEVTTVKIDRVINQSQLRQWINLFEFDKTTGLKTFSRPETSYINYYHNNSTAILTSKPKKNIYSLKVETYGNQIPSYVNVTATNRSGLVYNIPKKAAIQIAKIKYVDLGNRESKSTSQQVIVEKIIASSNVVLPQMGTIGFLKRNQSLTNIELDPASGALRKVSVENNAITADQIKNIGTTAGSFADLKKTELSQLENEAKLLEQKEKILKLKLSLDSLSKK